MPAPQLKVVESLRETTAADIAAMLRQSAESIESETDEDARTVAMIAVQVCEGQAVKVYGWGQTDSLHALGALQLGATEIISGLASE